MYATSIIKVGKSRASGRLQLKNTNLTWRWWSNVLVMNAIVIDVQNFHPYMQVSGMTMMRKIGE